MRNILRQLVKSGLRTYTPAERSAWAFEQPAQLALAICSTLWCQSIAAALSSGTATRQLESCVAEIAEQLAGAAQAASTPLTALQRATLVALMTHDVHNRDVTADLAAQGCCSPHAFAWQKQLRCAAVPVAWEGRGAGWGRLHACREFLRACNTSATS